MSLRRKKTAKQRFEPEKWSVNRFRPTKLPEIVVRWEKPGKEYLNGALLCMMWECGRVYAFPGLDKMYYHQMKERDDPDELLSNLLKMYPDSELSVFRKVQDVDPEMTAILEKLYYEWGLDDLYHASF